MKTLFHPVVVLVVRVVLGGSLLYASYHKIIDPPDFRKIVTNYRLFPGEIVNSIAIYFPWLEVFVGASLISGVGRRGAAILATGMFASFIAILCYNLARECPTICGCFSTFAHGAKLTTDEKFAQMRREIWRVDLPSLLAAIYVLVARPADRLRAVGRPANARQP